MKLFEAMVSVQVYYAAEIWKCITVGYDGTTACLIVFIKASWYRHAPGAPSFRPLSVCLKRKNMAENGKSIARYFLQWSKQHVVRHKKVNVKKSSETRINTVSAFPIWSNLL